MRPLQQLGSHSCPLPCPGALAHPTPPHTAPHSGEAPDFGRALSSRGRPRVFRFSVSAALGRPRCSASDEPARGPCVLVEIYGVGVSGLGTGSSVPQHWRAPFRGATWCQGGRGAPEPATGTLLNLWVSAHRASERGTSRPFGRSLVLQGRAGASRCVQGTSRGPPPGGLAAAALLPSPCRLWGFLFVGRSFSRVAVVSPATVTLVARAHGASPATVTLVARARGASPAQPVSFHAGECVFGWRLLDAGPALWTPPPSCGVRSPPRSSQRGRGVLSGPRL